MSSNATATVLDAAKIRIHDNISVIPQTITSLLTVLFSTEKATHATLRECCLPHNAKHIDTNQNSGLS
ncbi:MAG: hypothetical protein WAK17_27305 [Candidatus Nitrosopolaris sp.]|jgi:hypothetical protein